MPETIEQIHPKPTSVEPLFRAALDVVLSTLKERMPEALYKEAYEHLHRRDGSGATLCFGGPLRDDLLARLLPWLDAEAPEAAARLRAAYVPQEWPGPLHEAIREPTAMPLTHAPSHDTLFPEEDLYAPAARVAPARRRGRRPPRP